MNILKKFLCATIITLLLGANITSCIVAVNDPPPPRHDEYCVEYYYDYYYTLCCAEGGYWDWYYHGWDWCEDYWY